MTSKPVVVAVTVNDDDTVSPDDVDQNGQLDDVDEGPFRPKMKPRWTVEPSMVVRSGDNTAIPPFTVAYVPIAEDPQLSATNTIRVTINAPRGYIVEMPLAAADNIEGSDDDAQRRIAALIMVTARRTPQLHSPSVTMVMSS